MKKIFFYFQKAHVNCVNQIEEVHYADYYEKFNII